MLAPAVAVLGCTVKTSWAAAPGTTLKAPLVAPVSPAPAALRV